MMNQRYDNNSGSSTLSALILGMVAGMAFMAFADRDKRRKILSTAGDLKNKATDTAYEIKDDVNNLMSDAQDKLKREKDKINEDLEDSGLKQQ